MNTESPRDLAGYIALVCSIITGLFFIVSSIVTDFPCQWLPIAITVFCTAIVTFFVSKFLIEKFIYKKIKLIYKTIHHSKQQKGAKTVVPSKDMLNTVKKDVEEWAEENEKALEQLQLKEEFSREFIGNVSHELKTPIFNIQGYVLTLLEGGLEDENINRKYLQRAEKSIDRMIHLVEDLDTITQIESKQLNLNAQRENLLEIANDVIESLESLAVEKGIKIKYNTLYDQPIYVMCDKKRITQVLTNLVVNSIKYGKEKGVTELRFFDMNDNILIEISDNGLGIKESHLPRLFERFYRVEESRSRDKGGTGLGLAIVKHIVDAHQQTINVRSTIGIGSTFSFTLAKG
ncbi:MAG: sensor histidine kinase [Flavobacteriales bacterium]|nr:sensor histidine kinase [Flavobacteriales bacterium]